MGVRIKLQRVKTTDRYVVFQNTDTVMDKDNRGNEIPKTVIASRTVYIHKSQVGDINELVLLDADTVASMDQALEQKGRKRSA